jgi:predicted TIM-barrel fold metal-dependent hydrolase
VFDERHGRERWVIGGRAVTAVANWAAAGWREYPPSFPPSLQEADEAAFDANARLRRMDAMGIYAEVLYPNLLAFLTYAFLNLKDEQLRLECVCAYNDFLAEFASVAPDRFVALTVLPFWDVEASVQELERARSLGHRGVIFIGKPHKFGLPRIHEEHWRPIFATAQDMGLSVNFHVGFQEFTEEEFLGQMRANVSRADFVKSTSLTMLGNSETIADVLLSGLCIKYPELKIVSVESGFGWLPYLLEALDWQWLNAGGAAEFPDRELPSFYFRRQLLGTFWFESQTIGRVIDLFADNIMFETDFPHPTSISPGPASSAKTPRDTLLGSLEGVDTDVVDKVTYRNAAEVYHVVGA